MPPPAPVGGAQHRNGVNVSHNGRQNIAGIAESHGWTVAIALDGVALHGMRTLAYTRGQDQILITWTPDNSAVWIAKNHGQPGEQTVDGPCGLLTAREWLQAPA